ncbi:MULTISPECIES: DNA repair protein RecO [Aerococcus]|uniref:DNA repair protein RecO n=1 Tax=Aerococcus TaxID=1375 RepID=UPI000DCC66E8|nr:DNA repair protein RecO [Aerococcus urinae]MDK6689050.1 DNA repair protein RecO [Aerococcus urinae]MDK8132236.1 DNA repair protein RecO [Aerococcus urinae]MDK8483723.1 DNA repair protein RecO [Aerococcus urinae]RAV92837.1 DNA repair protein RecO [Aerococcus tenax]
MTINQATFPGIVLYQRPYKEKDLLVKIFTQPYGKRMFFVRNIHKPNNVLKQPSFAFVRAEYIGTINDRGFSFLKEVKSMTFPKHTMSDLEAMAYASYLCHLVDASMPDREVDQVLFTQLEQALDKIETGFNPAIIANILEVQLLAKFGVMPQLHACQICQEDQGIFDFSVAFDGLLCQKHFDRDPRRLHWPARAAHFIKLFSQINFSILQSIQLNSQSQAMIRRAIDDLYDEYVGLHLKSKSFIDKLANFSNPLD